MRLLGYMPLIANFEDTLYSDSHLVYNFFLNLYHSTTVEFKVIIWLPKKSFFVLQQVISLRRLKIVVGFLLFGSDSSMLYV